VSSDTSFRVQMLL